jgi:hypothetical protein
MNSNLGLPNELKEKIEQGEWLQQCYSCQGTYLLTYPFYIHNCSKCQKKCCLSCLTLISYNNKNPIKNIRHCRTCQ